MSLKSDRLEIGLSIYYMLVYIIVCFLRKFDSDRKKNIAHACASPSLVPSVSFCTKLHSRRGKVPDYGKSVSCCTSHNMCTSHGKTQRQRCRPPDKSA